MDKKKLITPGTTMFAHVLERHTELLDDVDWSLDDSFKPERERTPEDGYPTDIAYLCTGLKLPICEDLVEARILAEEINVRIIAKSFFDNCSLEEVEEGSPIYDAARGSHGISEQLIINMVANRLGLTPDEVEDLIDGEQVVVGKIELEEAEDGVPRTR